jgi:hypothetical protein
MVASEFIPTPLRDGATFQLRAYSSVAGIEFVWVGERCAVNVRREQENSGDDALRRVAIAPVVIDARERLAL